MTDVPNDAKKPQDHRSKVEGRTFTWATEDGATLTLPLRIKMKVLRELNDVVLDADGMYRTVEAIAPDQVSVVDEMDVNDFTAAYEAWQDAYAGQAGAGLGESSSSSS